MFQHLPLYKTIQSLIPCLLTVVTSVTLKLPNHFPATLHVYVSSVIRPYCLYSHLLFLTALEFGFYPHQCTKMAFSKITNGFLLLNALSSFHSSPYLSSQWCSPLLCTPFFVFQIAISTSSNRCPVAFSALGFGFSVSLNVPKLTLLRVFAQVVPWAYNTDSQTCHSTNSCWSQH